MTADRSPPGGDESPSPRPARARPQLVVELPLEGAPLVRLVAESHEDEQRLVAWLLRSRELRQLGLVVFAALDQRERATR